MSIHSDLSFIDSTSINTMSQDLFHQQANAMGGISKAIYKLLNNNSHTSTYQRLVLDNITYNTNRVTLNPYHPCHLLLEAYEQWDVDYVLQCFADKGLSPYCRLLLQADQFVDIRHKINLQCDNELDSKGYKRLSIDSSSLESLYLLLDNITHQANNPAFSSALNQYHHQTGYTENLKEYQYHIDQLFARYSRLLIIRVDLGYVQGNTVDYETFNDHATRFLKRINNNSIFDDLVGYIAKREHGFERGYHIHLLLAYNSAKRMADAHLGQQVGELWQRMTQGRGSYFNCNTDQHKQTYPVCFLGQVHRNDTQQINTLKETGISYLVKPDEYFWLTKPYGRNLLSRGRVK